MVILTVVVGSTSSGRIQDNVSAVIILPFLSTLSKLTSHRSNVVGIKFAAATLHPYNIAIPTNTKTIIHITFFNNVEKNPP